MSAFLVKIWEGLWEFVNKGREPFMSVSQVLVSMSSPPVEQIKEE